MARVFRGVTDTLIQPSRYDRLVILFGAFVGLACLVLLSLLYIAIVRTLTPPYEYLADEIDVGAHCAGDLFVVEVPIHVNRAPVVTYIAETWRNKTTGLPRATQQPPRTFIVPDTAVTAIEIEVQVPDYVDPGDYWYYRSFASSRADLLRLDVTIVPPEECG